MNGWEGGPGRRPVAGLVGLLRGGNSLPSGELCLPPSKGDDAWGETLRDLKRTLEGGGIFVVGRDQRTPVGDPAKESGDVSQGACEEAFQSLSRRITHELLAQAKGLSTSDTSDGSCLTEGCVRPAMHDGPCMDGDLNELKSALEESDLDRQALEEAMKRMAAHLSVSPGMQAIMKHSMPPSLWQPAFAICVGGGQLRVLMVAFVGEPVAGDRPNNKSTPYVLRLLSGNLMPEAGEAVENVRYCVRPAVHGVKTVEKHLVALEPELFEAVDSGDWRPLTEPTTGTSTTSSRCPSVGPSTPMQARSGNSVTPKKPKINGEPGSVNVGDRAARMRATFERAQSRPAVRQTPQQEVPRLGRARTDSAMLTALEGLATPKSDAQQPPAVSVLADGLSVKSVAGALNNVAATTGKIGSLFRRARSPAWLKGGRQGDNESSTRSLLTADSSQLDLAAKFDAVKKAGADTILKVHSARGAFTPQPAPPPHVQSARPVLKHTATAPVGAQLVDATAVHPSMHPSLVAAPMAYAAATLPVAAPAAAPAVLEGIATAPPAPVVVPAAATPASAVAAAPAPARQVVDRAERMRQRINRAQSTKRHMMEAKLPQTAKVGA